MSQPLSAVLARWDVSPSVIGAEEAQGELALVFSSLRDRAILRPISPAGSFTCTECGETRRVNYLADDADAKHGYIHCRDCGISRVPAGLLDRWEIDTAALLAAIFEGVRLSLNERVKGRLWQVGKATWAGRSREAWFAHRFQRESVAPAVQELKRRPKAILFAPTEAAAAGRWQEASGNLTLALETVLSLAGDRIEFDAAYVEGRIIDAGLGAGSAAARRPRARKREVRAAKIEVLRKEIIQHLLAARDYAFAAKDRTGKPKLLPRPSQKELGQRVELSESDVSRCLRDDKAAELRLYWDTAADLDQIMTWPGPIARGRKST